MSSATQYEPRAGAAVAGAMADKLLKDGDGARQMREAMDRVKMLGMSPRQQELNRRWGWFCTVQYDTRRLDWEGKERFAHIEHEAIATAGFLPSGFYDAGETMPLKFRRPSIAYHLARVIVSRFTSLLFSVSQNPRIVVEGDQKTEDFAGALVKAARLWPAMIMARNQGGAMGSTCLGFQFINGRPIVEVHDPRWVFPEFIDRIDWKLKSLEIRYQYPVEIRDPESGAWNEVPFWYRRIITEESDVLFKSVPVEDTEPYPWPIERGVEHNLGFCPAVWIQNIPVKDDVDGEPDVWGAYDLFEQIDTLLSQSSRGTVANCDPTLLLKTKADLINIKKGTGNAIKLPGETDDARYMEISGSGLQRAQELTKQLRDYALEVTQCVLDHPDTANRTATEIERVYSSMLSKADVLREQYGQHGLKPLVEMMIAAARQLGKPKAEGDSIVRSEVKLAPKLVKHDDGRVETKSHELGQGGDVDVKWGPYFAPSPSDAQTATTAAAAAKGARILGDEEASRYVASFFGVSDVAAMVKRIREQQKAEEEQLLRSMGGESLPEE